MSNLPQLIFGGLSAGAIYALIALGLSMIYKSTGILSFAQGSVLMIGGYTSFLTLVGLNLSYPLAILLVALAGAATGLILYWLSFKPLRGAEHLTVVLATLAVGLIIQDIARLVFQSSRYGVPAVAGTNPIVLGPLLVTGQGVWVLSATVVIMGLLALWFRLSLQGIAMRATAQNQLGAALVGVRVSRMVALSVVVGCVLATLGGLLVAPSLGVSPAMGNILIKGFAASILGGFNSMVGAVAGGVLIGLSESVTGGYVEGYARDVIPFAVIMLTLLIRPAGLFGRVEEMR